MYRYRRAIPKRKLARNNGRTIRESEQLNELQSSIDMLNSMSNRISVCINSLSSVPSTINTFMYQLDNIRNQVMNLSSYNFNNVSSQLGSYIATINNFRSSTFEALSSIQVRVSEAENVLTRIIAIGEDPIVNNSIDKVRELCERLGDS